MAARVDSILVLFDLVFLKMLTEFVLSSLEPVMKKQKTGSESEESLRIETSNSARMQSRVHQKTVEGSSVSHSQTKVVDGEQKSGRVRINASLTRPCIALLEDACQENSRALTLGVGGRLRNLILILILILVLG